MRIGRTAFSILALSCCALVPNLSHAEDAVVAWNAAVLHALKQDASAPLLVARALAILHVAQGRAIEDEKQADEMAVAAAGYTVAITLLPGHRGEFETLWAKQLGADSARRRAGILKGEAAAHAVLAERENDGSATHVSYIPRTEPGQWRRTPPFMRPPELPQWAAQVKPFVLQSADQFRPAGPPAKVKRRHQREDSQSRLPMRALCQ